MSYHFLFGTTGAATAVYSAGNSGAVMASAIFRLGRLKGIDRPAIGALFPTQDPEQQVLVLDVGANMDSKPAYLHQWALLGNIYSRDVLQVREPRIGLLNIGEEECKGNDLALRTYPLMAAETRFRFAGNCEGRDVLSGEFDVVVCDGFTGNVLLKFLEAVGGVLLDVLKAELPRGRRGKVGSRTNFSRLYRPTTRIHRGDGAGLKEEEDFVDFRGGRVIQHASAAKGVEAHDIEINLFALRYGALVEVVHHAHCSERSSNGVGGVCAVHAMRLGP